MNNQETANAWFTATKPHGKSSNGNLNFSGNVLRSYSTPIAVKVTNTLTGAGVTLYTSERYSVTTSGKHMPAMHRASNYKGFEVPGEVLERLAGDCDSLTELKFNEHVWDLIRAHYEEKAREADEKASRARSDHMKAFHKKDASNALDNWYRFCLAFGRG